MTPELTAALVTGVATTMGVVLGGAVTAVSDALRARSSRIAAAEERQERFAAEAAAQERQREAESDARQEARRLEEEAIRLKARRQAEADVAAALKEIMQHVTSIDTSCRTYRRRYLWRVQICARTDLDLGTAQFLHVLAESARSARVARDVNLHVLRGAAEAELEALSRAVEFTLDGFTEHFHPNTWEWDGDLQVKREASIAQVLQACERLRIRIEYGE